MRALVLLLTVMGLTASSFGAAGDWQALGNVDEQVRLQASAKLIGQGAGGVPALVAAIDSDNPTAAKMGRESLLRLVSNAAGGANQPAVAAALVGELRGTAGQTHARATREVICEMLSLLGPEQSAIEALGHSLADAQLREAARRALAHIKGPGPTATLVAAMAGAEEAFKIDIIHALAERGDPAATAALLEQAARGQGQVRTAAWKALAGLPSPDAVKAFAEAVKSQDQVAISLLMDYAHTLLKAGMLKEADAVLALRKQAGPIEGLEKCRLLHIHARLGTPESIRLVLDALSDPDARIRGAALEAAVVLPGTEVTRTITQTMNASQGQAKIDLLEVLGKRGRQMDDRTVMLMYMAVLDQDEAVKIACIRAMQEAGVTSTVPTLINLLGGPPETVADAAEQALSRIPDPAVTAEVTQALARMNPLGKARLLRILSIRAGSGALDTIMQFVSDPSAAVRAAAYDSLGRLKAEGAYETLFAALDRSPGPDRDAAERTLKALSSDVITARLLTGYFESSDAQKPSLLRILAGRQLEAIDALLMSESKSSDQAVRQAAITAMAKRAKPTTAQSLLEAAKAGPPEIAAQALTGYLNTAANVEGQNPSAAGAMYMQALPLAAGEEQRRLILAGLGRAGDPGGPGVIEAVLPLASQGGLQSEAAGALIGLASRMADTNKPQAIAVLQEVLKHAGDSETQAAAIAGLRKLGVQLDPASEQGFITCWQLLGPVDRNWDPPGVQDLDGSAPLVVSGREHFWKKHHTPDPQGIVNLHQVLGQAAGMAGFAFAEVTADSAEELLLKVGSDDGIILWVNGQQVHAVGSDRLLVVDEDTVKVALKAGKNRILARIQQADGKWQFCVRAVGPDGQPAKLRQRCEQD